MAEALSNETNIDNPKEKGDSPECAVCLQPCIHPAQLPCGHIFCYLCVKGFANQNKKCAMCRQEIPSDFVEQPKLLQPPLLVENTHGFDGGYQWFYEGRDGWWQYDERTSKEIEVSYKNGEKSCELLIAGFLYIVDLENMLQLRRSDPSRRRKIKRDYATIQKKGIAGLRTNEENNYNLESLEEERSFGLIDGETDNIIPRTPSNTPHSSASGRTSPDPVEDLATTVERISSLRLDSPPSLEDDDNTFSDTIIGDHHCRHRSID